MVVGQPACFRFSVNRLSRSSYDAAGNQTSLVSFGIGYDAENRQTRTTINSVTAQYAYDGDGRRVKKVSGGVTTVYVYDAQGQLAAEYASAAGAAPPCLTCYLTADHLGSTRLVSDGHTVCAKRYDYRPFGEDIPVGIGDRSTNLCYGVTDPTTIQFTGKERDSETVSSATKGLDYFEARYLSAAQGRFTSPDPIHFQAEMLTDPQRFNLYAYVRNNPLRYTDPSGEKIELSCHNDRECDQQLAAIQDALGQEAGQRLTYVQDKDSGKYFVQIQGDAKSFAATNGAAASFAKIIGNDEIAKFAVVSGAQRLELSGSHGPLSLNQGGFGLTGRDNEGQLWVYVQRPSEGYPDVEASKMSGLSWFTRTFGSWFGLGGMRDLGIVTGHEFGHALGLMEQRQAGQPTNVDRTNPDALRLENQVRRIKDPNGPVRVAH